MQSQLKDSKPVGKGILAPEKNFPQVAAQVSAASGLALWPASVVEATWGLWGSGLGVGPSGRKGISNESRSAKHCILQGSEKDFTFSPFYYYFLKASSSAPTSLRWRRHQPSLQTWTLALNMCSCQTEVGKCLPRGKTWEEGPQRSNVAERKGKRKSQENKREKNKQNSKLFPALAFVTQWLEHWPAHQKGHGYFRVNLLSCEYPQ